MTPPSQEELYVKYIGKLRALSESGVPIIVEGIRDERRLRALGVFGPVLKIQGKRVAVWVETLPPEFIVMTDFDRQGAKYAGQLKRLGEQNKKKADTFLRVKIFSNTFAKTVEDLPFPD